MVALGSCWDSEEAPSYDHFRHYAIFVPDLADFALTERQCGRLLADCGLDMCIGIGLGDVRILYHRLAKQDHITYDGLSKLYGMLAARRKNHIQAEMSAPQQRPSTSSAARTSFSLGSISAPPAGPMPLQTPFSPGSNRASLVGPTSLHASGSLHASMPAGISDKGSVRFTELLKPQPPNPITPSSAGTLTAGMVRQSAGLHRPPSAWGTPNAAPACPLPNMAAVMAAREPPLVLRETLPMPACDFLHIRSKLKGVKALMLNHEIKLCLSALKDLYVEWEQAIEEKQTKNRTRRKKTGDTAPTEEPSPAMTSAAGELPMEGTMFLLLTAACCSISLGEFGTASLLLATAESKFDVSILGLQHPYYYAIFLCQGLVSYYDGQFEDALQRFERARELSDLVARGAVDPTARKNSACCLNNMGACCQMMGRRAEAVASYRAAVESLRSTCGGNDPAATSAMANLAKAVRSSFAIDPQRPRTAPPAGGLRPTAPQPLQAPGAQLGVSGLPTSVSSAGGRLQAFLRQAITMSQPRPVDKMPLWATRSNGEEAAKKAAAKAKGKGKETKAKDAKGKDGKKKKAPKGFQISYPLTYYNPPTFGVANVSLVAKRKPKKKPAVAAPAAAI